MPKRAILLDLGGTLVDYFARDEFPGLLAEGIDLVVAHLTRVGRALPSRDDLARRVAEENHEAADYQVRPMEDRLARIFALDDADRSRGLHLDLCRVFMAPIFARAHRFDETLPALRELRSRGYALALISNTTWGSPAALWREEIARHGLVDFFDVAVFCRDIGWRKPARGIFEHTLTQLAVSPEECLFVGDDPRWDLAGPRSCGIEAVLLDRTSRNADPKMNWIPDLASLHTRLP